MRLRRSFCTVLAASLFLFAGAIASAEMEESALVVRGSYKTFLNVFDISDFRPDRDQNGTPISSDSNQLLEGGSTNHLRYRMLWKPLSRWSAEGAYELIATVQGTRSGSLSSVSDQNELIRIMSKEIARSFAFPPTDDTAMLSYRATDLDRRLYPANKGADERERSFLLYQNLDRAFITYSSDAADISLGRQPIAFGSARVINPTDILAPFTYTSLDTEERIGVDAIRVRVPLGALSQVDAGIVCGKDCESKESAAFLQSKWYVRETDIAPIVLAFKENLLLGIDITRSLMDAGSWIEAAYVYDGILGSEPARQNYWRVSTGVDYTFTADLSGYIEYHGNGAGVSRPSEYSGLLGTPFSSGTGSGRPTAYEEGGVYLLGRHYLSPGLTWQFSPLLLVSANGLYNMEDESALLSPGLQYSISDEAVLEAGAFFSIGARPVIMLNTFTGAASITARSEFGLYPNRYYVAARMYF
jgi:hypothetical protein